LSPGSPLVFNELASSDLSLTKCHTRRKVRAVEVVHGSNYLAPDADWRP